MRDAAAERSEAEREAARLDAEAQQAKTTAAALDRINEENNS